LSVVVHFAGPDASVGGYGSAVSLAASFGQLASIAASQQSRETDMSEETAKTAADHVTDTLAQLKEMRHYSKGNVERLTAAWLLFDGELSKLKQTEKIDDLMNRQGQLHDTLETVIADLEEVLQKMQPPEDSA
jgi:hypothetical protein